MAFNTIIQCSSSSSHTIRTTYDVFVSFRGKDTCNNFTGFLFQTLRRNGIDAFKDDAVLKTGKFIVPLMLLATNLHTSAIALKHPRVVFFQFSMMLIH
ncbi:Toll/interleukin-1 receptor-like protein [Glycine max]|nr:Toll/interleukin-1 receptor-like protein [Glycine max]